MSDTQNVVSLSCHHELEPSEFISNQYFLMECISGSDLLKAWPRIQTTGNLTLKVI